MPTPSYPGMDPFTTVSTTAKGTLAKHLKDSKSFIYTLVAHVPLDQRKGIFEMVDRLTKARPTFRSYARWAHITILGLRDGTQPELTAQQAETLVQASKTAVREAFQGIPPLRIRLDVLRPGYIPGMPGVSDSTVVWVADEHSEQEILDLTARYRTALQRRVPDLPLGLHRKMGGVWLTMGLFDEEEDFNIDGLLEQAFKELADKAIEIELDAVVSCQARRKSLEDGRALDHMLLTEPVNPCPAEPSVENPKVGVPVPRLKSFAGLTDILLNPRSEPYVGTGFEEIRDDIEAEPELRLFQSIFRALDEQDLNKQALTCGLAMLEPPTVHVTKMGLIDQDNVGLLNGQDRTEYHSYFASMPGSVSKGMPPSLSKVLPEYQQDRLIPPIRLRFRKLTLWGGPSFPLVARLEPLDGQSYSAYYSINQDRMCTWERLSVLADDRTAWPKLGNWTPHGSIAYVVHEDFVPKVKLRIADWTKAIRARAKEDCVEFAETGAYAFSDMGRFIKVNGYNRPPAVVYRLEREKQLPALAPGKRGAVKQCVTTIRQSSEVLIKHANGDSLEDEKQPVLVCGDLEIALFSQDSSQDRHFHKVAIEIYVVCAGMMRIEVEGEVYELSAGDMIVVNPGAIHEVRPMGSRFLCRLIAARSAGPADKFIVR